MTWKSKKQSVVPHSSIEAEYRAMTHTTCVLTWLCTLLQEFEIPVDGPTTLDCDHQTAIHIANDPVFHEKTKYIEVELKEISMPFVPSSS